MQRQIFKLHAVHPRPSEQIMKICGVAVVLYGGHAARVVVALPAVLSLSVKNGSAWPAYVGCLRLRRSFLRLSPTVGVTTFFSLSSALKI